MYSQNVLFHFLIYVNDLTATYFLKPQYSISVLKVSLSLYQSILICTVFCWWLHSRANWLFPTVWI